MLLNIVGVQIIPNSLEYVPIGQCPSYISAQKELNRLARGSTEYKQRLSTLRGRVVYASTHLPGIKVTHIAKHLESRRQNIDLCLEFRNHTLFSTWNPGP